MSQVDLLSEGPGTLDLSGVTHFVLDEADRMLDLGFEPDIAAIVTHLPPKEARRTIMFSATCTLANKSPRVCI
jgi:superfamily II DNA/RNA helicase